MNLRRLAIIALLLATATRSTHAEPDSRDYAAALHAYDYAQTMWLAGHCNHENWHEQNVILGRCPTKAQVTGYFAATGVLLWIASDQPWARDWLPQLWAIVGLAAVANNQTIGIKVEF
jgi:hypothetical protein